MHVFKSGGVDFGRRSRVEGDSRLCFAESGGVDFGASRESRCEQGELRAPLHHQSAVDKGRVAKVRSRFAHGDACPGKSGVVDFERGAGEEEMVGGSHATLRCEMKGPALGGSLQGLRFGV